MSQSEDFMEDPLKQCVHLTYRESRPVEVPNIQTNIAFFRQRRQKSRRRVFTADFISTKENHQWETFGPPISVPRRSCVDNQKICNVDVVEVNGGTGDLRTDNLHDIVNSVGVTTTIFPCLPSSMIVTSSLHRAH